MGKEVTMAKSKSVRQSFSLPAEVNVALEEELARRRLEEVKRDGKATTSASGLVAEALKMYLKLPPK